MNSLIRLALRRGWRHGVVKGNRAWLAVGALAVLARLLQRAIAKKEAVVFREVLRPGERLVITHDQPA